MRRITYLFSAVVALAGVLVTPGTTLSGSRSLQGWAAGTPADCDDTLRFAELTAYAP